MSKKTKYEGYLGRTVAETDWHPTPRSDDHAPKQNVVYIVLDDMGFSQLGCYGSNIETPNINRLAAGGLRYNNFHTTAICSATRASLLTGANHHAVGVNALTEAIEVPGSPNSIGHISENYATIAEVLKHNGYTTFCVGKWHLCQANAKSAAGPFDQWPLGRGFDRFYGFLHPMTDHFHPYLYRDNSIAPQPKTVEEGYHLSEDLTENAIDFLGTHINAYPEKPFFLYLAYGATHSPHHAPKEYINRYKGQFDIGWDEIRNQWFARQKSEGIIPVDAELTERNEFVPAWDSLSADEQKLYARYMEVFAGFLTHTDAQIGKVIEFLEKMGKLNDTILVFLSDNGASAEGGQCGRINETVGMTFRAGSNDLDLGLKHIDLIGSEHTHNHYPMGWANAGNTPFQWYKVMAHSGGVKDPLIFYNPTLIVNGGEVRRQYHHVSDITPTVLDLLGIEKPEFIKGVPQKPFTGISMKYTLTKSDSKSKKRVQYFEVMGNRGIWKDGWKAIVNHTFSDSYDDDIWELYHTDEDYSEKYNVADQFPEKLRELQDEFMIEGAKNNVFPMLPGSFHSGKNKGPSHNLTRGLYAGFDRTYCCITKPFDLPDGAIPIYGAHTITADIDRKGDGVLFTNGDRFGGFVLYVKDGFLRYVYNTGERNWQSIASKDKVPLGKSRIDLSFLRLEKDAARIKISINDAPQGELLITNIQPLYVAWTATIGGNHYSPVSEDYKTPFAFHGEIEKLHLRVNAGIETKEAIEAFFRGD